MKNEIWKSIKNYEGYYEVSNFGRVKSLTKEWVAGKGSIRKKGETILRFSKVKARNGIYYHVNVCVDKERRSLRINRLVAEHFCEKPQGCEVVNHLDCDTTNNRADNLEWTTTLGNVRYSWEKGFKKSLKGEKHGMAKLKPEDVRNIRKLSGNGKTHTEICKLFNVTRSNVTQIVNGKRWKHI